MGGERGVALLVCTACKEGRGAGGGGGVTVSVAPMPVWPRLAVVCQPVTVSMLELGSHDRVDLHPY